MITGKMRLFLDRLADRGYSLEEVRGCIVSENGEEITVDETHADYPRERRRMGDTLPNSGPGTELKAILRDWLGITPSEGCSCNSMAARMDALGPDWCQSDDGMTEILGVMRTEHTKRLADGRTRLPWTDLGARTLVKLACRRAEAKASA